MNIKKQDIYKCEVCGLIVEAVHGAEADLVCCGKEMRLMAANTNDEADFEKHVPVIEKTDYGYFVKVGHIPHPMGDSHYIEWIELIVDDTKVYRVYLSPESLPQAEFRVPEGSKVEAREYCNLHGLWTKQ